MRIGKQTETESSDAVKYIKEQTVKEKPEQ